MEHIKVLAFDTGGTVLDWHAGLTTAMATWGVAHGIERAKESDALPMIRQIVATVTEIHADESGAWNLLHASYPMKRGNHSVEFKSDEGACTNEAESFFSRLRRSETNIHHRISGRLLEAYALEPV